MRRRVVICLAASALAVGAVSAVDAPAGATPKPSRPKPQTSFFDSRQAGSVQTRAVRDRLALRQSATPAVRALKSSLGSQGVVDIDATTLTPRIVARLDGFLTGRSSAPAATIAMSYVKSHLAAFHLATADLHTLHLARTYVDIDGVRHLSWEQREHGVPLFGNGLKASVTRAGQLINVEGSPVAGLRVPASGLAFSRSSAIVRAKTSLGATHTAPAKGDVASRVLFATAAGARPAYQVVTMSISSPSLVVLDAVTGRTLYRMPLSADAKDPTTDETASVFDNYPGAAVGGTQRTVDLTSKGWLPAGSVVLFGNNVHTYSDVNDDNAPNPSEEVPPNSAGTYVYPQARFGHVDAEPCSTSVCTWNPNEPYSWQKNRAQTSTQNFFFINNYHDHLAAAPIGFTEAAGNFQQVNHSGQGLGGDPVQDQPLDGADTANGLPDGFHIDNANFATPPDGQAPVMQMYLWHYPGAKYPSQDPFIAAAGSDESDIVYHEYTHGLSHRLVVDADNVPALDSQQGGSMGEAWSDWYALDYLVNQGFYTDTSAPGEIEIGKYVLPNGNLRTEPTDCPVGASADICPGTPGAGPGGYTYGDFGKIYSGGPEVHADGEIWAQTLWDLRSKYGSALSESLITRAMELSPTYPSFLDMRNAILQADVADHGGKHLEGIWRVFAHRGMGFFAGTVGGGDVHPVESFAMPPRPGTPKVTVSGRVVQSRTGVPIANAIVGFGGHDSGFPGSYTATTGADGRYAIPGVVVGTYPDVYAGGAGYNARVRTVPVSTSRHTINWDLVRDWAAASGGATIAGTNADDSAPGGCGAAALIDQSLTHGWSTANTGAPKYVTIALPNPVDISSLQVDPSGTCGDDVNASAAQYSIETSTDGTTFVPAASGTFTPADTGHLTAVPLAPGTGTGVRAVRYTVFSNQAAERGVDCTNAPAEGCAWFDSQEVEVFGVGH